MNPKPQAQRATETASAYLNSSIQIFPYAKLQTSSLRYLSLRRSELRLSRKFVVRAAKLNFLLVGQHVVRRDFDTGLYRNEAAGKYSLSILRTFLTSSPDRRRIAEDSRILLVRNIEILNQEQKSKAICLHETLRLMRFLPGEIESAILSSFPDVCHSAHLYDTDVCSCRLRCGT